MTIDDMKSNEADRSSKVLRNSVAAVLIAATAWLLKRWTSPKPNGLSHRKDTESGRPASQVLEETGPPASLVIGTFTDEHGTVKAVKAVQAEWSRDYQVYSPNLNEKLFEAMNLQKSPTRVWILTGAVIGQLGGWATTIMLTIYFPHRVASMPFIAIPPFAIISFEMMVLLGVGAGLFGVLFHCRLPDLEAPPDILRRFKQDRFGIVLKCDGREQVLRARMLLERQGVENIQYV
jgi:hypothetical protein